MFKYSLLFVAVLCCSLFIQSCSNDDLSNNNLDIYLLIGQSNMAGRAPISGSDLDTLQNVYLFTGVADNEWEKAANPLNKYSTIRKDISMQKLGPGYHFAKTMIENNASKTIGLVVNAKGGTSIAEWAPNGDFYNEAVKQTKAALEFGELKGIVWHQGESDASKYDSYTPKIIALIEALRADFNLPELPVVVGQLSEDKVKRIDFNEMILQLPDEIEHVGVATSEGTSTIDSTHFDAASQKLLGTRYAIKMQELIQKD